METQPQDIDRVLGQMCSDVLVLTVDDMSEGTLADKAGRLDSILAMQARLKDLRAALELELIEAMPEDNVTVPHVGTLRRVRKKRSVWRNPHAKVAMRQDIAVAVAKKVATDPFTGEIDSAKRQGALEGVEKAWVVIPSFTSMLVAGQQELGLDQSDYTETEEYLGLEIQPQEEG